MQSNAIIELKQPELTFAASTLAGTKLYPDCLVMNPTAEKAKVGLSSPPPPCHLHPHFHFKFLTDNFSTLVGSV